MLQDNSEPSSSIAVFSIEQKRSRQQPYGGTIANIPYQHPTPIKSVRYRYYQSSHPNHRLRFELL